MVPQVKPKGWEGYWQGLHYPTMEELMAQVPSIIEWEERFVRQIRMDQLEEYIAMKEEIQDGETTG